MAAGLPASALLLATLMVIGFGSLGQFPTYYAFTQELSARRMGHVTGVLSFLTWTVHALVQEPIGRWLDRPTVRSGHLLAGLMPILGLLAVVLLWNAEVERLYPSVTTRLCAYASSRTIIIAPFVSFVDRLSLRSLFLAASLAHGPRGPLGLPARRRRRSCWPTRLCRSSWSLPSRR